MRDYCGRLVVSHDIPNAGCLAFEDLLKIYCEYDRELCLAVNIKADGLQRLLFDLLQEYNVENYFVFDMSIPDTLGYLNLRMNVFVRQSEFEMTPSFYNQAYGVWMDEFDGHWITEKKVLHHLDKGKKVCIVSPELHQGNHLPAWADYKILAKTSNHEQLMLCTDTPEEARRFFND